jgi:mRNA-degrading endonuclease RelE of RelBE toxin-antitoxin system
MAPGMRDQVMKAIGELEDDPFPANSVELRGHRNYNRLKIPPYRILYRVGQSSIFIERIEKRTTRTYRGFNPR